MSEKAVNISLNSELKSKLDQKFSEYGFTDSKEAIQYLLDGFADGSVELVEKMDEETARKFEQAMQEFSQGESGLIDFNDPETVERFLADDE
ncbi:MAG: hypothetical protein OXU45_03075 [Candidatus Melainabacteria bacterium]|nr:hypothetical protein [Candidatus Melainabacteria bacterium]